MDCHQVREYLDTTLPEERSDEMIGQIDLHTRGCAGCAAYMAQIDALETQLRALPPIPADPSVIPAVMQRVRRAAPATSLAGGWAAEAIRWTALAAGLVICAMAYFARVGTAPWLERLTTPHAAPAGLVNPALQQPGPPMLLCGLGTLLAAAAVLWHRQEQYEPSVQGHPAP